MYLRLGVEEIGHVAELLGLLGDGADPAGVRVAQGVDSDTGVKVKVLAAILFGKLEGNWQVESARCVEGKRGSGEVVNMYVRGTHRPSKS